jgi:zinc transporter 7
MSAMLNVLADAAHNFTDGVALAAAFSSSWSLGVSTTLAVLLHELPHELADVVLLLRARFSLGYALRMQLVTALGALAGSVLTLVAAQTIAQRFVEVAVLPLTAGGFIYVACVDILAPLLSSRSAVHHTMGYAALQVTALVTGILTMVVVGMLE